MTLPFIVIKVLTIMDPLSCDNAIYEDVKVKSSSGETLNIHENTCYGEVTHTANENKHEEKSHYYCYSKVIIIVFVIVFSLLLGTAGTCVAFAVQIVTLKSEIESIKMASSFQNTVTDSLEEVVHQLNISDNMLYQQLSQDYTALDNRTQQLNASTQLLFSDLEHVSGLYPFYPTTSCASLPPSSPSGYYWVMASNGSAVSVYCDMTLSCGGVTGGRIRVAELDMTNSSHQCPSGLRQRIDSDKRTCVKIEATYGCTTLNYFIESNLQYSNICGRVIGYQIGSTDAFYYGSDNISSVYVDGVSLTRTHGNLTHHIWTFASGIHRAASGLATCPCSGSDATPPPVFVGEDYFCDSGNSGNSSIQDSLYGDDPLWDGAGCIRAGNTCCSFNSPPWFYKQLPQLTTDDIEMRVCTSGGNENIAIEIVEIFIQ